MTIELNNIICSTFYNIAGDIINCNVDRAVLKGGRNSTKSQTVSECIIIGCMVYKKSAVAIIKYANKIDERLVSTFRDSMKYLGVEHKWKLRKSPFEYVLLDKNNKETDISIKFTGADNPELIKSYRSRSGGGFRYIWFEEATNFNSVNEINSISDTMGRGDGDHCVILTYNPPQDTQNWVNIEYDAPCGIMLGHEKNEYKEIKKYVLNNEEHEMVQIVHHSTYLDVIADGHANWLGLNFIARAEQSKLEKEKYYRWNYLGEVTGTDANIFNNICDWHYDNEIIQSFNLVHRGIDFSHGGKDPFVYLELYYDKENHDLYILNECFLYSPDNTIKDMGVAIKKLNINNRAIYCDSADPGRITELNRIGCNCLPCTKYHDSVMTGIEWLQSLNHIYIDKIRCQHTYKEFKGYHWEINKYGEITHTPIDMNNHSIDAARYALQDRVFDGSYLRNKIHSEVIG